MRLRVSEWIVLTYFAYLAGTAIAVPLASDRRRRIVSVAMFVAATVLSVAAFGETGSAAVFRNWLPLAYIVIGYWLPASLVTAPDEVFERVLLTLDDRWCGRDRLAAFAARGPRRLVETFELAYSLCYPLVPAGLACLHLAGLQDETNRFWTAVLLAVFSSYGALPWLPTRPPRAVERPTVQSRSRTRSVNLKMLSLASIQLNTFPSGHAAASLATALAVGARLPLAGLVLGLIALMISVGSVTGRYHYAADVLTGAALALIAFVVSRIVQ